MKRRYGQIAVFIITLFVLYNLAPAAEPGKRDKNAPKKFTTTKSGLKYRILRKSKGKKPAVTDKVTVHYRGWLPDKTGDGGKD